MNGSTGIMRTSVAVSALLCLALAAGPGAQVEYTNNFRYNVGQGIQPVFEGWSHAPDGSINMHFGYLNRNYVEMPYIPVGPNNKFEPDEPDRGQPTFFYTRTNRNLFTVNVPKDWPINRDLVWTLTVNGKTEKAFGWLRIEWEIDPAGGAGGGGGSTSPERKNNQPPQVTIDPVSAAKVSAPVRLVATIADDGLPKPRAGRRPARVASRAGNTADAAGRRRSAGQRAGGGAGRPRREPSRRHRGWRRTRTAAPARTDGRLDGLAGTGRGHVRSCGDRGRQAHRQRHLHQTRRVHPARRPERHARVGHGQVREGCRPVEDAEVAEGRRGAEGEPPFAPFVFLGMIDSRRAGLSGPPCRQHEIRLPGSGRPVARRGCRAVRAARRAACGARGHEPAEPGRPIRIHVVEHLPRLSSIAVRVVAHVVSPHHDAGGRPRHGRR